METTTLRIGGMSCTSCQRRIEKKLKNTGGIVDAAVSYSRGTAAVTYDARVISLSGIVEVIESLDYRVPGGGEQSGSGTALRTAGTLAIILALFMLLRNFSTSGLASAFPLAEAGMGYGLIFIIGLVSSVHCAAMCGGINLSQCIRDTPETGDKKRAAAVPSLLYNGGRILSYTAVGIVAGTAGQAVSLSGRFQGMVQLGAGIFMVIMGINMLDLFPGLRRFMPRPPKFLTEKTGGLRGKGPLVIGLLNGLMPCGPLQAMQLYALSTGSPLRGGLSMLLFSLGTSPLMFGLGALGSFLSGGGRGRVFTGRVMKLGAVLVTALGLTMFSSGWNLSGFGFNVIDRIWNTPGLQAAAAFEPVIDGGYQVVRSTLLPGRYPAITVQQGIPVRWTIDAPRENINGCNNRMIIREYGVEHRFTPGENVIEFVPEKTGRFYYSCWMGMIRSSVTVTAPGETAAENDPGSEPVPAGVTIPSGAIAVAELSEDGRFQTLSIALTDDGFEPAVLAVQKNLPVLWTIVNDSLDPGNSRLLFPVYYTAVDMKQGENGIQFIAEEDFEFSTVDNVFYGYVKAVEDLRNINPDAVRADVSAHETLIYPEAYFEAGPSASCCAR
ncbi:MAG: sulfite exporter TauE/SafE family protein [Spirochaetaceae bacterium]|jgi:sulfite exporter TauE/SafE/copper chaperone CopZ/plastocyanin domain-containing protein|nr:sulfite exporter TauE/SafE family protein [Spirochaetaceae bacterium]